MNNDELINYYASLIEQNSIIDDSEFNDYNIKKGLRNADDTGVIVGITKIGAVLGYHKKNNKKIAQEGRLFFREYELKDLFNLVDQTKPYRFEQIMYLLLFSNLPDNEQLTSFRNLLASQQELPNEFCEDFILRKPSVNIMNQLQRVILCLYTLDDNADEISFTNLTKQAISIIAKFTSLVAYSYNAHINKYLNDSLVIHRPLVELSISENFLRMIRKDGYFSEVEADVLDVVLVVHADHGGGNNSTFTTHVVSSTQTDTYSSISASIGSLKGPKHGGANERVKSMIVDLKASIDVYEDKQIYDYLVSLINKEGFDKTGLIYGMGHAIYTISDPRVTILKDKAFELAKEKNLVDEYYLYEKIEKNAIKAFKDIKGEDFKICANVDLYSGLVYEMLNISPLLFTPLFALARVASWNAHRIEQIFSDKKIIRPAYVSITNNGTIIE